LQGRNKKPSRHRDKGKKEEKGWGGKKDWIEEGQIGKRTTGKEEKKGKEGERDKGKGKGAEGKKQLGKRGRA